MTERMVVACVQQRMHLPATIDEYREDLRRFLRVAVNKRAALVVFPELGGVMIGAPIVQDFRSRLLKQADRAERKRATIWQRVSGALAGSLADYLQADFRRSLRGLLDVAPGELSRYYFELFGELARESGLVVVAPSAFVPDPVDGVIRNLCAVFGADGSLLGTQAKIVPHPEDGDIAQVGSTWDVVQSDVGRLGILLGSDMLYPEAGRVLAYQGADVLVGLAACKDPASYSKVRAGALARMQENQLFAVVSFLVGPNRFSRKQREPFIGKSAVFAPQELTPRYNGVLVEMGNQRSEGVLTAEWDFAALRRLWESSETPLRQQIPVAQAGPILAQMYARLRTLPAPDDGASTGTELARVGATERRLDDVYPLDELPVQNSFTSRWPLATATIGAGQDGEAGRTRAVRERAADQEVSATVLDGVQAIELSGRAEEETDEMDAVG